LIVALGLQSSVKPEGYSFIQSSFITMFLGISNVYGSPIMTLAGAPLTTYSTISNGAIHFPSNDK
jgi:hypothetical protein